MISRQPPGRNRNVVPAAAYDWPMVGGRSGRPLNEVAFARRTRSVNVSAPSSSVLQFLFLWNPPGARLNWTNSILLYSITDSWRMPQFAYWRQIARSH